MDDTQIYFQDGDCLVVRRDHAERLFNLLGCVNVHKWDADVLVMRLRRIGLFCDNDIYIGEYASLARAITQLGVDGTIILKNHLYPVGAPSDVTEISYTDEALKKKSQRPRKKRKRGPLFSFAACDIPIGATLVLKRDPAITCKVVGDPLLVDFGDGLDTSFSRRTAQFLGTKTSTCVSPMHYWMYEGKLLKWYYAENQKENRRSKHAESR